MDKNKPKYLNIRASDALFSKIDTIHSLLSKKLSMRVSRVFVVNLLLAEGIRVFEVDTI